MKKMFKIFILLFIFSSQIIFAEQNISDKAYEAYKKGEKLYQSKNYDEALKWLLTSYKLEEDANVANNIGLTYKASKDYIQAEKWYKKAIEMGNADGGANLGLLYKKVFKDYPNAIKWYKKAYNMGNSDGAYNLGYLYDVDKKDYKNAIEWYKKAARKGHKKAINNLGEVYHDLKDNITASAYILAGIEYGYDKKETFEYLKNTWKVTDTELKEAYKLQQTLDIPKHYTAGID